jgi:RNA recognition motif-containing protein
LHIFHFGCNVALPQDIFSQYGKILHIKVVRDKKTGRSKSFGYVLFDSEESAADAIRCKNGSILMSKQIQVFLKEHSDGQDSGKCKIYITGFPTSYSREDVQELFSKVFTILKKMWN